MADGQPRTESLLLELVGALIGRSNRRDRHHSRSVEAVPTLQYIAGVAAGAVTHAGVQATADIVVPLWTAVLANDPVLADVPAVHGP